MATGSSAQNSSTLQQTYHRLLPQLRNNAFHRPLVLQSGEPQSRVQGDVYAEIGQPFSLVEKALSAPSAWCEVLMLHLNVKACRAWPGGDGLDLYLGSKRDQPLADTSKLAFAFQQTGRTPGSLDVAMLSAGGPLGTSDYRIRLEATPVADGRSFLHLAYSYRYGLSARLATETYLATRGRGKRGFSLSGHDQSGQPLYQDGVRGVVERNTMRYYLAIEVYLASLNLAAAQRGEQRLSDWYAATERYPAQLHELERTEYLAMKRRELQRQVSLH